MSENSDFIGSLPADLTPDGAPGAPVEAGQYAYMVTTGSYMFSAADSVFDRPAEKHFSTITDGPYSSTALAEKAANIRFENSVGRYGTIDGQMEPYARGLRGPHGGIVSWKRDLTCIDHTGVFGNQPGWQTINLVYVDEMP